MISALDNTSTSFDYGIANSVVENPLVDAANGLEAHSNHDHVSVSVLNNKDKQHIFSNISFDEDMENKHVFQNGHRKHSSRYKIAESLSVSVKHTLFIDVLMCLHSILLCTETYRDQPFVLASVRYRNGKRHLII